MPRATSTATAKRPSGQKRQVWDQNDKFKRTRSGLRRTDLTLSSSKRGGSKRQVVSRKRQQQASRNRCLAAWRSSMNKVKQQHGISRKSFLKVKKGSAMYKRIHKDYKRSKPRKCMR